VASKSELLAEVPLFAGLTASELDALGYRAVEKRFASDDTLFWEGEPCAGMFVLIEGSLKIFKTSASGREMMLALENAPSTVAELPLFDGGPYPASVRAVGDAATLFINKADFYQVCRQHPEVALKVLAVVGKRLRQLVAIVEAVTFGSVTKRLAALLLDLSAQAGSDDFALTLTHQELASRLGTVREVVSRNLARFRAEGLIKMQAQKLVISDRPGLEREAEAES
jgi:CRP/FNR family transcriptional regulator, cyclic AMP receptor protein